MLAKTVWKTYSGHTAAAYAIINNITIIIIIITCTIEFS